MNADQWRARPLVVTVKELCCSCSTLKEGVKLRYVQGAPFKSCEPCFDTETRNKAATSDEDYYAW